MTSPFPEKQPATSEISQPMARGQTGLAIRLVYSMIILLAVYAALYVFLRAVKYIHVIGGVGLGGNGYQVECYWLDSAGKPRFYTPGEAVLYVFWPCWKVECMVRRQHRLRTSAKKIT